MKKLLLLATASAVMSQLTAQAQLVTYTINNTDTQSPTVTDSSTTSATNLTFGAGFEYAGNSSQGVGNVYAIDPGPSGNVYQTSLAGAVSSNNYFTFTLTPATGDKLNLTSIDFSSTDFVSQNRPREFTLESSVTGFGGAGSNILGTFLTPNLSNDGTLVNLDPDTFSKINSPVEFRIYVDDSPDGSNGGYETSALGGNIKVNGTGAAIPEPSAAALLAGSLLGLGLLLRHRKNSAA